MPPTRPSDLTPHQVMQQPISRRGLLGLSAVVVGATVLETACTPSAGGSSSAAPEATSTPSTDSTLTEQVAQLVRERWPYSQTIWPGLDYSQHDIVLFQASADLKPEKAWLVTLQSVTELEPDAYAALSVPLSYAPIDFQGKKSIALNMSRPNPLGGEEILSENEELSSESELPEETSSGLELVRQEPAMDLFLLASHELVHFYYQDALVDVPQSTRAPAYPLAAEPRILRGMLLYSLTRAVLEETDRDTHLGHARYWQDRWQAEHPDEAKQIHSTDIAEGPARYVEDYFLLLDPKESSASQKESRNQLFAKYGTEPAGVVDLESYLLGSVAGVLLDNAQPGWKEVFYSSQKTPTELLLDSIEPIEEQVDDELRSRIEEAQQAENEMIAPDMKFVDEVLADTSVAFVRFNGGMPHWAGLGSYVYRDYLVYIQTSVTVQATGGDISVQGYTLFEMEADKQVSLPLPKGSHSFSDGTLTITSDQVRGTAKATLTQENGRDIYTITRAE